MTSILLRLSATCILISLIACSVIDSGNGGDPNGDGPGTFSAQMTGNWNGYMRNKTVEAGSALSGNEVVAEFKFTSETKGTFKIKIPNLENAEAEGTFTDFAGKSLHLKLVKSGISTLGATGSTTSVNYSLIGDTLELSNDRISLELTKSGESTGSSNDNGTQPTVNDEDIAIGLWNCSDKFAAVWKFNIKTASTFSIDVFSGSGNASSIWLEGAMGLEVADDKTVSGMGLITGSSNDAYVAMRLRMKFANAKSLTVDRMKSKDETDTEIEDTFTCAKQ